MSTNFEGWLIKFGNQELPLKYLGFDECSGTPNTRTEEDAWRDLNNYLHREVYDEFKTKLSWKTIPNLTLEEKIEMQGIFNAGLIDAKERKYLVTYWNDEENRYVESEFYFFDTTYPWKQVDLLNNTIIYGAISFEMFEY